MRPTASLNRVAPSATACASTAQRCGGLVLLGLLAAASPVGAQERAGRFTMSPAEGGGFVRLDTETGSMALCARRDGAWSCEPMSDSTAALKAETEKLKKENVELRAEIKRLDDLLGLGENKSREAPKSGGLQLPSEQDVDRTLDYVERMFKKLRDRLQQLDPGAESPKGGPAPAPGGSQDAPKTGTPL